MRKGTRSGALLAALLVVGCGVAPNAGLLTTPMVDVFEGVEPRSVPMHVLQASSSFPAPIDSVVPSSTRSDFFPVLHVRDDRLTSAWGPAENDSAPSLTFHLSEKVTVSGVGIKLSLGRFSSPSNQRVLVDVDVSHNGGNHWTNVATDLNPPETVFTTLTYKDAHAVDAVRLRFRATTGNDISELLVCEANVIDPVVTTPGGGNGGGGNGGTNGQGNGGTNGQGNGGTNGQGNGGGGGTNGETDGGGDGGTEVVTTPTATPTVTPTATPTVTPTATPTVTPVPTSTPVPTPTPTPCAFFVTFSRGGWGQAVGGSSTPAVWRDLNWGLLEGAYGDPTVVELPGTSYSFDTSQSLVDFFGSGPSGLDAQVVAGYFNYLKSTVDGSGGLASVPILTGPFAGETVGSFGLLALALVNGDTSVLTSERTVQAFTAQAQSVTLFFHFPGAGPDGVSFGCPAP